VAPPQQTPPAVARPARAGSPAPRTPHRLNAIELDDERPIQRVVRVLEAAPATYATAAAVTAHIAEDGTALNAATTSAHTYTVRNDVALTALARGQQANVLAQRRYIIGENHAASEFDRISGEWPTVPTMGEGVYTTEEAAPQMSTGSATGPNTFANIMNGRNSVMQGLENFHTAALARIGAFLLLWNEYHAQVQHPPVSANADRLFREKVADFEQVVNVYSNVSTSVYMRGMANSWTGIWARYAGKIEEAYGGMSDLLLEATSRTATDEVHALVVAIGGAAPIPPISAQTYTRVQTFAAALVPKAVAILAASVHGTAQAAPVGVASGTAATYLGANAKTMADAQTDATFAAVNPAREIFMGRRIQGLARPGLVKVGSAHVAGLTAQNLPDTVLFKNAGLFDAAIVKRANELP